MADQPSLQERGEHAPQNLGEGEAAPLDLKSEQGEGVGLPGTGASDGGIGQGGAAGIGPGLPAAPADPALMAMLQQLLASNHAIAARIICLQTILALPQAAGATTAAAVAVVAAAAGATLPSLAGSQTSRWRYRRGAISSVGWRRHG